MKNKYVNKIGVMLKSFCSASQPLAWKRRDPEQQHLRMTLSCSVGFTLIELLVVVLIIGILSAVALPQYQRAVEKARVSEVLTNNKAIENALDLYVLENGYPTTDEVQVKDFVELSGGEWDGNDYYTKHFDYSGKCIRGGCCITEHYARNDKYAFQCEKGKCGSNTYTDWHCLCVTQTNDLGRFICKSLDGLGWEYADSDM